MPQQKQGPTAILRSESRSPSQPLSSQERARLIAIIRDRSFATGRFRLASGWESNLYFNLKPTLLHPEGAYLTAKALLAFAQELEPDFIGGIEMGAVPIVGALAAVGYAAGRPVATFIVRKARKDHGTKLGIEGLKKDETLAGHRVVIVDDVTTTGGSTVKAIEEARAAGANVADAISIVDREEGAVENLAAIGVALRSVLKASDFV